MIVRLPRFGVERLLTGATLLALVACSDRSPTAPGSNVETARTSAGSTAIADRGHRTAPRLVAPRGGGAPLPVGLWGGEGAELIVTENAATVRLFCAHGSTDQPILLDAASRFSVTGWVVREGGPVPIDETAFRRPALYSGATSNQTLTLTVFVDNTPRGPFSLIYGKGSTLGPCPIL